MIRNCFSPFRIKGLELKNRIVMPGLASFLFEDDGSVTERTVEHYRRRAAGGPAMVITEACAVSPEGIVSLHQGRIYDDCFIEGFSRIAAVIKSEGAVPAMQIHHSGRQTSARVIGQHPVAPSALPCPSIRGAVTPLTVEAIQELVRKFGDAAQRAREAGFELIEVHGAHGYLINQFLSGFSNIRKDEYGGDSGGRARFAREIVQEIRRRLGSAFPISFKISAQEFVSGGLTVADSIPILKILVEAGIDVVQVSAGNDATPEWICQPMFMQKACLTDSAEQIKRALNIPVMTVGRIVHPEIAGEIIEKNRADLICMGRGLLADPDMPNKAVTGRLDEIRPCIACNTCMEAIFRKGHVECLVNPAIGRETDMTFQPALAARKIMVVGGGPGGLQAAWVAAERGHEVHLYEKRDFSGGKLIEGSVARYKKELCNLIRFMETQARSVGVRFHLGCEATPNIVRAENPEVLILATGGLPSIPPVEGIDNEMVTTVDDIMNGDRPFPAQTVVIGGGATGCEVALHLAEFGCPVTVVEMLPQIAASLDTITRKMFFKKLKENNVSILTEFKLKRIKNDGVVVTGKANEERFIEAKRVVIAAGNRPDNLLFDQIVSDGYEIHRIGDCVEPRSAKEAIYEGALLGGSL